MKIKQIIILYENGNAKGYNLNAFLKVFRFKLKEWLAQGGY